MFRRK